MTKTQLNPKSEHVERISFNEDAKEMSVFFVKGDKYKYKNISSYIRENLSEAAELSKKDETFSFSKFFRKLIVSQPKKFPYEKIQ